ncbi:MAG: GTP-binding protein [Asgard group archaeon]|nr:GTP-binding protein [Asgard group archaeon]
MEPIIKTRFHPQEIPLNYIKIVLVGDSKVGKTTLLHALTGTGIAEQGYSVSLINRIDEARKGKEHAAVGRIYDLRSQRYFPYLHSLFYNGAKGAIIVFEVTDRKSFSNVTKWRDIIWGHAGNIPLLLCGNKSDLGLSSDDHISISEAETLAQELTKKQQTEVPYMEISALKHIIAYTNLEEDKTSIVEDIYPTVSAFRQPFIRWIFEIVKKGLPPEDI